MLCLIADYAEVAVECFLWQSIGNTYPAVAWELGHPSGSWFFYSRRRTQIFDFLLLSLQQTAIVCNYVCNRQSLNKHIPFHTGHTGYLLIPVGPKQTQPSATARYRAISSHRGRFKVLRRARLRRFSALRATAMNGKRKKRAGQACLRRNKNNGPDQVRGLPQEFSAAPPRVHPPQGFWGPNQGQDR